MDLVRQNHEVIGIDVSDEMIRAAEHGRKNLELSQQAHLDFMTGTLESAEFRDKVFQTVVCLGVLEYLDHPEVLLKEVYRVLRPGGTAVFQVPNKRALGELTMGLAFKVNQILGRAQPLSFQRAPLASKALSALLLTQGFEKLAISYCYYYVYPFADLFQKMSDRINDHLVRKSQRWFSDSLAGTFIIQASKPFQVGNC
jgi:ubiquinone/menaquinone biosynthesis C-methylase UbiE